MTTVAKFYRTAFFRHLKVKLVALYLCIQVALLAQVAAQPYEGLIYMKDYRTQTYFSPGSGTQAKEMAERCDKVMSFYNGIIDSEPTVSLLVLSQADWSKHTSFPVYGMPHYADNKLIVASEDNDFWRSFLPEMDKLSTELVSQISATYKDERGELTMRGFFDLLAIHELGHAFHDQGGLTMQRKWMGELFANIFLHTYIAEEEPALLPSLTIFPTMVVASTDRRDLVYTSLNDLETNYDKLGREYPNNYGWYQCRWHVAAGTIYDKGGVASFKNLWQALQDQKENLNDAAFVALLASKVHQSVADVPLKWDE